MVLPYLFSKHTFMEKRNLIIGIVASVLIVVLAASVARIAFAQGPTPQQKAAQELPTVIQTIEDTQDAHDRNEQAKARKEKLMACIGGGDCSFLQARTPGQQ